MSSSLSSSSDFTRDVCTGDAAVGTGEGTAKSFESATAANALFRDRGRSPFAEPFCDGGRSVFNKPSIFDSVFWIVSETSESLAETAAASLLRVRDGGRSASTGSFLETSGDVALPIGASSLFLSVVFSAPRGAFSREGGFFFFAFFGFLSSSFRTSSFSFCFADEEFFKSLAFFLRCSSYSVR